VSSYYPTVFRSQIAGHRECHPYRRLLWASHARDPLHSLGRLGSVRFPDLRRGQFTVSAGGMVKIPDRCIRDQ
jgi:hypothetical protein